jgi:two-component system cell cycle sensor histidine kinase/response regulator CckA
MRAGKRKAIMSRKPTYQELEIRVKELEKEVIERNHVEEALRESEDRFKLLVEDAPFGISIMKPDGDLVYVNQKFTETFGYTVEDIPDKQIWLEKPYPDKAYRDTVIAAWRKDLIEDQTFGEVKSKTFTVSCRDGRDKVIHFRSFLLQDGWHYITYEDITSQIKAEEWYRTLVEGSFNGIFIQKGSTIIFANHRLHEMLGYDPGELIGLEHWRVYHPEYQQLTRQRADARLRGEMVPSVYEVKLQCKDKSWLYGEINARATTLEGEPGIQVWVRDITQRKRAEEALRASEEKYRTILETIEEGYYETGIQGNFTFFNDSLCEILGYSRNELLGLNNRMITDRENAESIYKTFDQVYTTGTPVMALDHDIIRKDGKKRYVEVSVSLKKDPKGIPVGFCGIIRDLTERKQAEKEIERRQRYLESVLHNAPDAIVTLDASHRIREWNPGAEQIFGYTRNEVVGKDLDDLIAPRNVQDEARSITQKVLSGETVPPRETVRYRKDGTEVNVIISASPIIIDEKLQGIVAMYTGITERKRVEEEKKILEAQLQYAQKMEAVGTLAAGIAHNFNNLLMGIQGNTSLMFLKTDPGHPFYARLKSIETAVANGSKLTSQLLGYARKGRYEVKLLDVNRLVMETSETFATAKREIRIHRELDEELWGILADQGQIEQGLLNLYVNAADAMPRGGDLFLKTEKVTHRDLVGKPYEVKPGNYVLISLRDTGVGMDEKTMQRIFDPFFTTKGFSRGTGLGLASVYGIIKAHAGYIDVKSKKGQGTTFSIYLPASGRISREEYEPCSEIITGTETVLLVDDEEMILEVGAQMLEALGYKVLVARSGKEAIDIYKDNIDTIEVIVLDMIMPDMGGGETFNRLRGINRGVRVLLSSGYSIDGQAQEIIERGCDAFIQKPFRMEELSQKIREIVT